MNLFQLCAIGSEKTEALQCYNNVTKVTKHQTLNQQLLNGLHRAPLVLKAMLKEHN